MTRADGVNLYRTYSDEGYLIERDGVRYEEAVDPEGTGRVYIETDEFISTPPEDEVEDMRNALNMLGVNADGQVD